MSSRVRGPIARAHALPVDIEARPHERYAHGRATREPNRGLVRIVCRLQQDHLVARVDHGLHGAEDRLGTAGRHRDFRLRADGSAVDREHLLRDRLAQCQPAGHWRVLVCARAHVRADELDQPGRRGEVRITLRQVDGRMFGGQPRHHGEDRGANLGQLGRRLPHSRSGSPGAAAAPCADIASSTAANAAPISPASLPNPCNDDLGAASKQVPEGSPVLGHAAADDEQLRPQQSVIARRAPRSARQPTPPSRGRVRRACAPMRAVRPPRRRPEVTELGIGQQPPVDEKRRADPGAQREHQTMPSRPRAAPCRISAMPAASASFRKATGRWRRASSSARRWCRSSVGRRWLPSMRPRASRLTEMRNRPARRGQPRAIPASTSTTSAGEACAGVGTRRAGSISVPRTGSTRAGLYDTSLRRRRRGRAFQQHPVSGTRRSPDSRSVLLEIVDQFLVRRQRHLHVAIARLLLPGHQEARDQRPRSGRC